MKLSEPVNIIGISMVGVGNFLEFLQMKKLYSISFNNFPPSAFDTTDNGRSFAMLAPLFIVFIRFSPPVANFNRVKKWLTRKNLSFK